MTISFFSTRNRLLPCLLLPITIFLLYSTTASCTSITDEGRTLGKADWDFNEDPCNGSSWFSQSEVPNGNAVNCTCDGAANSTATVCHIVSISLKSQNLSGTLPPGLTKLPFLQNLDLTRNYLNGSIPREWGSMRLVNISLLGNRLSGSIPKELGNISTLANLTLEHNQFSGVIPRELGNLPVLEKIFLNSNNFTGELPLTFANLVNLREFRIGDNNFTGKIPDYIMGWTRIQKLMIQGMEGPIPLGIANLTDLTDLRITDLYGPEESTFPPFRNMTRLKNMILRNCNITGPLPPDSFGTTKLKILDLSFNKLSGPIPHSFDTLKETDYILMSSVRLWHQPVSSILCVGDLEDAQSKSVGYFQVYNYLTGNMLSGNVPNWMLSEGQKIDLSYNNFTLSGQTCQPISTNLFAASSKNNVSGILSCLGERFCPEYRSFLYIDCGGLGGIIDGKNYEKDDVSGDASKFFEVKNMWGFSSTGHFIDDYIPTDTYIVENASRRSVDRPDLYMNARRSPLSLTYYGDCLRNGNYTVKLHFAEIMFTDDETYSSLGRRIFDIYIQGKIVEKDFNIKDRAGGVGKEIITSYPKTLVDNGTLEIRFFWAGKGTTAIPLRGVYGPLISAISVEDGPSDGNSNGNSISGGAVAGIVVGVAIFIMLVLWLLWWTGFLQHEDTMGLDLKGIDLNSPFTLRQIKAATNNFASANKIGEGGFGSVYKGVLPNGITIAVKQLSSKSKQGNREFLNEIGMISALQHQHLVKMHGCCIEGNQLLLVYEYMENNSLARALFGPEEFQLELDWPTRYQICIGIARGLAYLHEESRLKIVHRDIKATNVLLDKNLVPKISDFGLAKLDEEENTHISTRVAGTYGYMAPEYALRGYLTDKADVYSYGIVVLEIVSGIGNIPDRMKENHFTLHERALKLKETENLMELIDPRLGSEYNEEEIMVAINVALLCTNLEPSERPMMSTVVNLLEGRTITQEILLRQSSSTKATKLNDNPQFRQVMSIGLSQDMSIPYSNTSTSAADLYPPILDSEYLEKRDIEMSSRLLP